MIKLSGMLFFIAGVWVIMGILTAEIFYPPGYSISQSMISNLAATRPPDSVIHQPSATIFNSSLIIAGGLIILGAFLAKFKHKYFLISLILMGLGTAGVGFFPAFHKSIHPFFALISFLIGGISALLSFKITTSPFKYLSVILGLTTLVSLFLGIFLTNFIVPIMGAGGIERWVAYPVMLWLMGFGGYLMAKNSQKI